MLILLSAFACQKDRVRHCELDRPDAGLVHVQGDRFVDDLGRRITLRGINAGGRSKMPPYSPFDYEEGEFDQALSAYLDHAERLGFSVLRVPFSWQALEPTRGLEDTDYIDRYTRLLEGAAGRDMWTIVDFHQDIYAENLCGDGFPAWTLEDPSEPHYDCGDWFLYYLTDDAVRAAFDDFWSGARGTRSDFVAMWQRQATRFRDTPGVIGFEIINEPGWGSNTDATFAADVLGPFYSEVGAAIAEAAPDHMLFFEPTGLDALTGETSLAPPVGDNWVFAPHYYDAAIVLGIESELAVEDGIGAWMALARDWDVPFLLGEFGVDVRAEDPAGFIREHYDALDELGASSTYWEYSVSDQMWNDEDFSIVESDGTPRAAMTDEVARPFVRALAGSGLETSWEEGVFTVSFTAELDEITEISVPPWVFSSEEDLLVSGSGACVAISGRHLLVEASQESVTLQITNR